MEASATTTVEIEVHALDTDTDNSSILMKPKHEEVMCKDLGNSTSAAGSSGSQDSDNINSDMCYNDDDNDDDKLVSDGDYVSDYDDNDDYMFEYDDDDHGNDDYLRMQAQFDNADLPPGIEASVSWLNNPTPITCVQAGLSNSVEETGTSDAMLYHSNNTSKDLAGSSSAVLPVFVSESNEEVGEQVMRNFEQFQSFDIVVDFSDHHFTSMGFQGQQPPRDWTKKIQDEWKILEKDLPDNIFVRVYESRMDLVRAVIIGPAGTPYHDGLFVFDVLFPTSYPDVPPMVYYYSGGLRLNPNLYDCGKVCLSLLNTWSGQGSEKWQPKKSTLLQVLVSIQALILNARPFFNEPGYDTAYPGEEGERKSKAYNEDVFILSLKTMMYTLRRPPKHFEVLVVGHFRTRAHAILSACKVYMDGAKVGSVAEGGVHEKDKDGTRGFKTALGRMMNGLVSNFSQYGAADCDKFRIADNI